MKLNAAALTQIRERSGYSKAAFARQCGISASYLTELEKGDKANAGPEVIKRMAEVLKCPLVALIANPDSAVPA